MMKTRLNSLLATLLLAFAPAHAGMPAAGPTTEDIIEALSAPARPSGRRSFKPTAAPDRSTNACAEPAGAASTPPARRNLNVVPYAGSAAAGLDLDVRFAVNSDAIDGGSLGVLTRLGEALNSPALSGVHVAIAGHTDRQGGHEHNLKLSCARAIAVKNWLIREGVEAERLGAYGFGPDRPLEVGKRVSEANRRVEIRRAN